MMYNPSHMNPRKVTDVIKQILPLIPDTEYELKRDIKKYYDSLGYCADELLEGPDTWVPFINIMNYYVKVFDEEWKLVTRNIIANEPATVRTP